IRLAHHQEPLLCFDINDEILAAGTELIRDREAKILFCKSISSEIISLNHDLIPPTLFPSSPVSRDARTTAVLSEFVESHSEDVTQIHFHPAKSHTLLSASVDGLVCIYDVTLFDEDEALVAVVNSGSSVSKAGFFGPDAEYLYCLTHIETFSLHTATENMVLWGLEKIEDGEDAHRVYNVILSHRSSLKATLSVTLATSAAPPNPTFYSLITSLIASMTWTRSGYTWSVGRTGPIRPNENKVTLNIDKAVQRDHCTISNNCKRFVLIIVFSSLPYPLLHASISGDINFLHVNMNQLQLCQVLRGGHTEVVRSVHWDTKTNMLLSGAEDAKLCLWTGTHIDKPVVVPTPKPVAPIKVSPRAERG
ncbi:LOW QUALITY PROTEIN: hypothetical protein BC936DRAFT_143594, partial [Jimgerdemannia flammicorona]